MQQLTLLDIPEKRLSIRIMDRIGSNYNTLGTFLLDDNDGGILRMIEHDHKFAEKIVREIFYRWIKEQGEKNRLNTNTWEMLVKYLRISRLLTLANEIENVLSFCTEHVDNEECAREQMYEGMSLETKPFLQYLIPMLAPVVVAAIFGWKSKPVN